MIRNYYNCAVAGIVCALAAQAGASMIVAGTHTDHPLVAGAQLDDVRLQVQMTVSAGEALVTFTNVSTAPEFSASLKEIVIDGKDDDSGTPILWDPEILTNTNDVKYRLANFNGLPGYVPVLKNDAGMFSFMARPAAPKRGINPGESLAVLFKTSLADGSDIANYLAAFDLGDDTARYSVGFHAISADIIDGESLSGVYDIPDQPNTEVPEPGTMTLLVIGAIGAILRRRRRR